MRVFASLPRLKKGAGVLMLVEGCLSLSRPQMLMQGLGSARCDAVVAT